MSSGNKQALVVFTDDSNLFFLKVLKRGFRHCFVMLHDGKNWISVDPLLSQLLINVEENTHDKKELIEWFKESGYRVVTSDIPETICVSFLGIYSCVGVIKKILGVRNPFILTPHQLFKHISQNNFQEENTYG